MFMNSRVLIVLLVSLCITSAAFILLSDLSTESYDYVAGTNQYSSHSIDMSNASPHSTANLGHSEYGGGMSMPKLSRSQGLKLSKASISPTAYTNVSSVVSTPPSNGGGWRLHTTSSAEYTSFGGGNISDGYSNATGTKRSTTLAQASTTITAPMYTSSNVPTLQGQTTSTNISASIANPGISAVSAAATPSAYNQSTLLSYNGGIITETYGGMSLSGSFGGRGIMRAAGLGNADFDPWLEGLIGNYDAGYSYEDEEGNAYFQLDKLKAWFEEMANENGDLLINGVTYSWSDFLAWFFKNGSNGEEGYGDNNEFWRVPMHDGTCVWLIITMLYILFIYLRSHSKKVSNKA